MTKRTSSIGLILILVAYSITWWVAFDGIRETAALRDRLALAEAHLELMSDLALECEDYMNLVTDDGHAVVSK